MPELMGRLQALETEIRYREPPPTGMPEFAYIPGGLPILLSAPHGAAHTRNGRVKGEDEYTSSFARLVAERSAAHVLYTHHQSLTDPNYDRHAPYKIFLKRLVKTAQIRFVLDIHGAAPHRDFGIALGTIHGRTCLPYQRRLIIETLATHGFKPGEPDLHRLDRLDIDQTFPGGEKQHTITHYVSHHLGVSAAQFELNAYLRTLRALTDERDQLFRTDLARLRRAIDAFVALVQALAVTEETPDC
ncbi:MAG: hypothetical protein AB1801_23635 [Chloroflexota bacterium]